MRNKRVLSGLLASFAFAALCISAQQAEKLPPINVKEYKLKNGLRVIHHLDRSTPVVSVGIMYSVGSKNEIPGRTGFAHLFEHMMFQGSQNYDSDYFTPLTEAGATINGNTTVDRTWYFETVPSNFLELALFMEADRMGGLLPAMTQEKLDNQRDVVKNERRQSYDNQPYGAASEKISAIMYPKSHPYNWTTIGSLEDLQAASMDDVKAFFRQYYVPNNATLVISGDFNEIHARKWVDKYFGKIPGGRAVKRPNPVQPKLDQVIRTVVEDPLAPLPRRYMVWHGVKAYAGDEPALDILANILSSGRGSRLQSNLLYGKEMVSQVGAFNDSGEIGGTFQITATARPNRSLEDIEQEINKEIERIKKEPPTEAELERAKNAIEAQSIYGLQTVLGKASQLANFTRLVGKPNYFQQDLDRYANVAPADIQRVANQYLTADHLIMTYVPKPGAGRRATQADTPTSVNSAKKDQAKVDAQAAKLPKGGPVPKFSLPAIEKTRFSNGLEVWMVEHRELPMLSMNLVLKTGQANEPDNRTGVAGLATSLLDDGTKTRSAVEIANGLQSIGANMGAGGGWDATNVSLTTLTKNLDQALAIYADVIQNPTFPDREFTSLRDRQIIGLRQQRANANAVSSTVYNKVLYGDHPYGRDSSEATLKSIDRGDVVRYYESTFRPNNGVLIVVGNYDKATMRAKLESAFAGWKPGEVFMRSLPPARSIDKTAIYLVDRPNSTQSIVGIGSVGIDRAHRDYFPVLLMNSILGGGITGRISMNLREDKGYTYGANSSFTFRRGPGPFRAGGAMQTAVTKESVAELMRELRGIRGDIPITPKELDYYKQRLIRLYPAGFETVGAISNQLANLVTYGLPDTYFNDYIEKVNAVTLDDVNRVAREYLDPSKMAIVIVGDRKVIEPGLKELGYPITLLDAEGNVVTQ
jgi:zinc protease